MRHANRIIISTLAIAAWLLPASPPAIASQPLASRTLVDHLPAIDPTVTHSDFNGDGHADLAVGIPYEDVDTLSNAGAVEVFYGSSTSPHLLSGVGDEFWTQDVAGVRGVAESGDKFGSALASGDFDGDGYDDLAIGVPGEDLESTSDTDAGVVAILYGSADGLTATGDQVWNQDSSGVEDQAEDGDSFGSALAVGDFHPPPSFSCPNPGVADVAIGIPNEDLSSSKTDAGAVEILFSSTDGLDDCGDEFWTQDSDTVPNSAEAGDHFGAALATGAFDVYGVGLAVGVPDEDVGAAIDAGGVNILESFAFGLIGSDEFWTEDFGDVDDEAETGDHFGSALAATDFYQVICCGEDLDDLAVGVWGEATDLGENVGAVHILPGDETDHGLMDFGEQYLTPTIPQAGERFGYSLAAGVAGSPFLAIGEPFADVGAIADAGTIQLKYWGIGTLGTWSQDSMDILDDAETADRFGWSLSASPTSDPYLAQLVIGVPRENVGDISNAGAINVLYASLAGFSAIDNQYWDQDSPSIANISESGDRFGEVTR